MSLISKEHLSMVLKSIKKLLGQKADRSELKEEISNVSKSLIQRITQPDWNQNDETQPDYVKNRTHWEMAYDNVEIVNTGEISLGINDTYYDDTQFLYLYQFSTPINLIGGKTYQVSWCGRTDSIVATDEMLSMSDSLWAFNMSETSLTITGPNSGATKLPFTTVVSVIGPTEVVHPIDEKYIPDSIARTEDIDELTGIVYFGSCYSGAATSEKIVSLNSSYGSRDFELKNGTIVSVNFAHSNTASSAKLNVNDTGAKSIKLLNSTSLISGHWDRDSYVTFTYRNNYWYIISVSPSIASTDYYGLTKLSTSTSSASTTTAATSSAVKEAYDKANGALPKMGGTMKGHIVLCADPAADMNPATKKYVDNAVSNIDIPEQVQSDWNQGDDAAVDFIKNKPFGIKDNVLSLPATSDQSGTANDLDFAKLLLQNKEIAEYKVDLVGDKVREYDYQSFEQLSDTQWKIKLLGSNTNENTLSYVTFDIETGLITMTTAALNFGNGIITIPEVNTVDEKFIPDSIARVKDIPDSIPTPTTAQVGQTIVVKSVDENGKPTEWEAVDPWVLVDQNTSIKYKLSVVDGKLTMDTVGSEV